MLPSLSSSGTALNQIAVIPNDSTIITRTRALYVGTGGNITVMPIFGGISVLYKNVPNGFVLPVSVIQVLSTGTTATDIVAWE